jgi:lipoic acid synthetase
MILGSNCTRDCRFCAVGNATPQPVDSFEPQHIAEAVKSLGLDYVVITSVTRDDLEDGGAGQFAKTIKAIRNINPRIKVEVLIPDFRIDTKEYVFNADKRKSNTDIRRLNFNLRPSAFDMRESALNMSFSIDSLKIVLDAKPDVLGHNIETVPRLYPLIRPQADYNRSISLLKKVKEFSIETLTKSGLMLGLGESLSEILDCIQDLKDANCDILVLGQYLAPSEKHAPVKRFYSPEEFEEFKKLALLKGFKAVVSGPLVRSSYKAQEVYKSILCSEAVECMT